MIERKNAKQNYGVDIKYFLYVLWHAFYHFYIPLHPYLVCNIRLVPLVQYFISALI